MKRKIIKLGGSTLVTSLPSKWIKEQGLNPGDEVELNTTDDTLTISTIKRKEKKASNFTIDYNEAGELTKRLVGALYKAGYDEISINIPSKSYNEIAEFIMIRELDGFEIISQTQQGIILRSISDHKEGEFENSFRRMFMIVINTFKEAMEAITAKDANLLNSFNERDIPINKLSNYCRRILNRQEGVDKKKIPFMYYFIEDLENIGDEVRNLALHFGKKKTYDVSADFKAQVVHTIKALEDFFVLYKNFEIQTGKDFLIEIKKIMAKETPDEIGHEPHRILKSILGLIYNMHGPLMTMFVLEQRN